MAILVIFSLTISVQSTGKQGFRDGTHRNTTRGHRDRETELPKWANSVKMEFVKTLIKFKEENKKI